MSPVLTPLLDPARRWPTLSRGAWLALTGLVPFLPAVSVPGYEQALATSVLVPILLGPWLLQVARQARRPGWGPVLAGAVLGALPAAWSAGVGALRGTLCALGPAAAHVVLGPVLSGAVLGAAAQLAVAVTSRRRPAAAVLGGVLGASVGGSLWRMYAEPQAFLLDPFLGYFRGPLYDEGMASWERPLALRAWSLALVLAALAVAGLLRAWRRQEGVLAALGAVLVALPLAALVSTETAAVRAPGRAGVLEVLDTTRETPHAVVHAKGSATPPAQLARIAVEVERNIGELQEALGVRLAAPVHVFLYPSSEEKGRLLGAADTLLARPWSSEIHVQGNTLPVAALRHELAHVVAGELVHGVFHVPMAGGVIPRVLLIEGLATALEEERGELTLMQQAAVMKRMGRLPPLERLLSLWGFFWEGGPRAYTTAGAFLRFLAQTRGLPALAAVYREGRVEAAGASLAELEAAWHAHLDALPVPEGHTSAARRHLSRGSVLERRCVDQATALWRSAQAAAEAGHLDEAESAWRGVLALDNQDDSPLRALLEAAAWAGDGTRVQAVAEELLSRPLDGPGRAQVFSELAAGWARSGELDRAREALGQALPTSESDAQRRTLEAAQFALDVVREQPEGSGCARGGLAVLRFLWGKGPERAKGRADLVSLLAAVGKVPAEEEACLGKARQLRGLILYLMGRQLVADSPADAGVLLGDARFFGLPSPLLVKAALQQRGEAAEDAGHYGVADTLYGMARERAELPAEQAQLDSLRKRVTFAERVQWERWARPGDP